MRQYHAFVLFGFLTVATSRHICSEGSLVCGHPATPRANTRTQLPFVSVLSRIGADEQLAPGEQGRGSEPQPRQSLDRRLHAFYRSHSANVHPYQSTLCRTFLSRENLHYTGKRSGKASGDASSATGRCQGGEVKTPLAGVAGGRGWITVTTEIPWLWRFRRNR